MTEPQRLPPNARRPRTANGQYVHKLTRQLIAAICGAIATGSTAKNAALIAGVSERTFYTWLENGRHGGRLLERELVAELDRTTAQVRATLESTVFGAAQNGDTKSAQFLLTHRADTRDDYRERSTLELGGEVRHEHRLTLDTSKLTTEQLQQIAAADRLVLESAGDVIDGEVIELPAK